jgi:hypothetical protein
MLTASNYFNENEMTEYDELFVQEVQCPEELLPIFKCFYQNLNMEVPDDRNNLNVGLNLFFGNFKEITKIKNNEKWKDFFKKSIKEKYETLDKNGNDKFKLKDPAKGVLDNWQSVDYINKAREKWLVIDDSLKTYFENLELVEKTLIYEAPPYLLSIDKSGNLNFEAEFIFDERCSSPYVNAIKNCFNMENRKAISEILIENNTGFFDVIPIPIPINSDLREKWATEDKFVINGKRIFVHFFEWALKIYLRKLKSIDLVNHKFAIGIPLKNAVTLYEYAEGNADWPIRGANFCALHEFNEANKKQVGLWVQRYKNCIIGSSNTPSGDLMKLAFGMTSS